MTAHLRATRPSRLRPDRRHRRVRHARGRREGEGAQGRGPTGDRVRRRRAGLPDAGVHRRGGGRGLPRPEEPPLHPGRRAARAQEGDRRRRPRATPGYEVEPAQVLVTNGGKQAVYEAFATMLDPGDEVIAAGAVLDDLPRGDPAGRRRAGRGARRRDPGLPGHRRAARGGAHRAHQGAALLLAVQPDRRRLPAERGRGDRPVGRGARPLGGHRRDLRAPGLRRRRRRLDAGAVPRARRQLRRRQRRREDLRDDRLAGRLDDRPDRRRQGRHQPAVARDVQRRQRLAAGRDRRGVGRPVARSTR